MNCEKENKVILQRENKIISLQIMRIIACFGVFNGHFLGHSINSEISHEFLYNIRTNWMSDTILSYFYMGDQNVKIFYVLGGFFVSFSLYNAFYDCKDWKILGNLIKRLMNLIIPSLVIIVITALVWWVVSYYGYDVFRTKEILFDCAKILIGKGDGYSPYYAYQLWYIYVMIKGYVLAFSFLALFGRTFTLRYVAYAIALFYFMFVDSALFCIFFGMLAGDIAKRVGQKTFNKICYSIYAIIGIILIIISPMLFDGSNKDIDVVLLGSVLSVVVLLMYIIETKQLFIEFKCIDFFDRYTYAFYLVHVFVLDLFSQIIFERINTYAHTRKDEMVIIIISYFVTISITMLIAIVFDHMVIQKNAKYAKLIVNKLEVSDRYNGNIKGDV